MRFFTSRDCSRTSNPATVAVPDVGGRKHVSMRMVVVLPAPLGPRNPTICPLWTSKEMWSTAVWRAYLLVRSVTVIIRIYLLAKDVQRVEPLHELQLLPVGRSNVKKWMPRLSNLD